MLEIIYAEKALVGSVAVLPDVGSNEFLHLLKLLPKADQAHGMQEIYAKVCQSMETEIPYYQENIFQFAFFQQEDNAANQEGRHKPNALILFDEGSLSDVAQGYAIVKIDEEFEYIEFDESGKPTPLSIENYAARMRIDVCLTLLRLYDAADKHDSHSEQVEQQTAVLTMVQEHDIAGIIAYKNELWQKLRQNLLQLVKTA